MIEPLGNYTQTATKKREPKNLFSLKNYYKIVVPYRAKTICRKFKTCFPQKAPKCSC